MGTSYEEVRHALYQEDIDGSTSLYPGGPPNDALTASITNPADGYIFDSGASVSFAGSAGDTEDGDITAGLVRHSNKDGQIRTGGSFSSTKLSDGNHTITPSATDSDSNAMSASIGITAGTPPSDLTTVSVS